MSTYTGEVIPGYDVWKTAWQEAWARTGFRVQTFISVPLLILALMTVSRFLLFVENRPGVELVDPLLNLFAPKDVTWITFGLIYGALLLVIPTLLHTPSRIIFGVQVYTVLITFRMAAMYLLPLEAPSTTIVLSDPVVELWTTASKPLTKDLFFSGHTSTLFMLYLCALTPKIKRLLLVGTIGVGACVIIQHVHYTVDVLAAPFFAYCAYRTIGLLQRKLRNTPWAMGEDR